METVEIPEYFICPISLQIMKDPVTAATGITYDRESIEQWLLKRHNTTCPVSKQPLPKDSHLIPNNTLRRLIRAWCTANSNITIIMGDVDDDPLIIPPTPSPPMTSSRFYLANLIRSLWLPNPQQQLEALQKLEALAKDNESNRKQMVEAGVAKPLLAFIVACHRRKESMSTGLAEALSIFFLVRSSLEQTKLVLLIHNDQVVVVNALAWVLRCDDDHHENHPTLMSTTVVKTHAIFALKILLVQIQKDQEPSANLLGRLDPDLFNKIIRYIKDIDENVDGTATDHHHHEGINAALQIMLDTCTWGRNRMMMVEAGAVSELIELEFNSRGRKTTELIFGILYHLCLCADGRAQFLGHAAGLAVVTKRMLKVSPAADNRAMLILSLISKFSGTVGVVQEMLRVGAVAKLCMVIQADCESHLRDQAREILRSHSHFWAKDSPCIHVPYPHQ